MTEATAIPGRRRPLRLVVLWLLMPAIFAAVVLATGVHMGARNPDAWYTQGARWVSDVLN